MESWQDTKVTFKHLSEGETINPKEYVKRLKALKLLGGNGVYVILKSYSSFRDGGFLWFSVDTLINYFSKFHTDALEIKCTEKSLIC